MNPGHRGFDWNDIPILLALARDGRMRTAGRRLGVDTSTISRRLAAAEQRLQTRLFIRTARGYEPTEAGRVFLEAAEAVEGGMRSLVSVTRSESERVSGPVRITSVDAMLSDWLVPRLPELLDAHPQLQLRLIPDNQNLSFSRGEADIALRIARPRDDAAVLARRVGQLGFAVYGAPAFRRVPRERWGDVPWLAYNDDLARTPEMQWLRRVAPAARHRLRSSSAASLLQGCEAGLGLALLPCLAVRNASLVRLSAEPELHRELWLLRHRDAARIKRFRVVADWLAARAEADRALLTGDG